MTQEQKDKRKVKKLIKDGWTSEYQCEQIMLELIEYGRQTKKWWKRETRKNS